MQYRQPSNAVQAATPCSTGNHSQAHHVKVATLPPLVTCGVVLRLCGCCCADEVDAWREAEAWAWGKGGSRHSRQRLGSREQQWEFTFVPPPYAPPTCHTNLAHINPAPPVPHLPAP